MLTRVSHEKLMEVDTVEIPGKLFLIKYYYEQKETEKLRKLHYYYYYCYLFSVLLRYKIYNGIAGLKKEAKELHPKTWC